MAPNTRNNTSAKWQMAINTEKTQVVHFRQPHKFKTSFPFSFGDSSLDISNIYKYLGVMFDEFLSFDINANVLSDSATRALGSIRLKFKHIKIMGTISAYRKSVGANLVIT